jgi:DnaD/phage-associated family protein
MAKFRHVHTEFWQDPKVLEEMTPEDKYFYLYLLTNPNTTQIGVYQITRKQMSFDLGYSIESINSLLNRFINNHKVVKYNDQTRELAILNWGKYNLNKAGKPVLDCIRKELTDVKDKTLLWEIMNHIPNEAVSNEFSRVVYDTYHESYHDTSTTGGQKEKEKEKEKEKITTTTANVVVYFENTLCRLSVNQTEKLYAWLDDFNGQADIIFEAINIADNRNKRTFGFVEYLLKEWSNSKLESLDRVKAYEQEKFNKQKPRGGYSKKPIRSEEAPEAVFARQKEQQQNKSPEEKAATQREIDEMLKALEN